MSSHSKVNVKVDARRVIGPCHHQWRYIGYDECNYTEMPEGRKLIEEFGSLQDSPYYIRAHHLLCTGNGRGAYKWGSTNVYTEDVQGNPVYHWETLDAILDTYVTNRCKPFFELGFLPMDLVNPAFFDHDSSSDPYSVYQRGGWATPPKDYAKWGQLVFRVVEHCVERYGEEEVLTWYWELWNEPDIFYWKGSVEELCKLYDYTEAAVHAVLDRARLGGPATCGPTPNNAAYEFLNQFLHHCSKGTNYVTGRQGTRLDFVTFHAKGGGFPFRIHASKDTPSVKRLLSQVKLGLEIIKDHGFSDCEIILSEADPDGWAAGGRFDNVNMNFRNTEYFASYVASSYRQIEKLASSMDMDVRPLAWTFTFPGERCFEGTRAFTTQGIHKAIFNLFKTYARLGNQYVFFESTHEKDALLYTDDYGLEEEPEVSGMATQSDDGTIGILIYSHHDDWDKVQDFKVTLEISHLLNHDKAVIHHYRIDESHSNAYSEWVRLGRPNYPNSEQYEAMKARDELEYFAPPQEVQLSNGTLTVEFPLPAHAISWIEVQT